MEEDKPAEKTEAPPAAVERAPKRGKAPAAAEPETAVAPLPVAPLPAAPKDKSSPNGDGRASFQIEISTPSDEVQAGRDARIVITLSNTSDREILFSHRPGGNNPEFSYRIEGRNAGGREGGEAGYRRWDRPGPQTEGPRGGCVAPGHS